MKVFVTGATGYIGSAITRALVRRGHDVLALTRSADTPLPAGVARVVGSLDDPVALTAAVHGVDGAVHAAATNDEAMARVDRLAAETMLAALAGGDRFYVHTSGVWVLGDTGDVPADETAPLRPPAVVAWRPAVEQRVAAARGVRAVTIRPGLVHGHGGGLVPAIVGPVDGAVRVLGDGRNRWSVVHVDDLADLYVRAAESAPPGSLYHGVSEVVRPRDAAQASGADVVSWPEDEAQARWGAAVEALTADQVVSAERARRELGWRPRRKRLADDLGRSLAPVAA